MAVAVQFALAAPALGAALLRPALGARARSALAGVAGVEKLVLDRALLAVLRARDAAVLDGFPLGPGRRGPVELRRFTPFAPRARAEIMTAQGARALALPDLAYFTGGVVGDPASRVVLIASVSHVHGFVVAGGEVYPFGPDAAGGHRTYALRAADPTLYPPPRDFCANDLEPQALVVPARAARSLTPLTAGAASPSRQADIAVDTDTELRAKFASDQAALGYLASLLAAATAIYERDVGVRLSFSYIRLWDPASGDPWTATSTSGQLSEVRSYWNNPANDMATIAGPRDLMHFLSGKPVQGGIGYVDVLCNQSFGYAVSQVYGSFDLSNPFQIWDVVVLTHEAGHNFGSEHTHCYSPPVDRCYAQESGCYNGSVVASRGTIMSYCHLLGGGLSNLDLVFGDVVSTRIGDSVAGAACLATIPTTTTTTTTTTTVTSTTAPSSTTSTTVASSTTTTTTTTTTSSTSTTAASSTTTTSSAPTTSSSTTVTTVGPSTSTTRPAALDGDGDGVLDDRDACGATPAGDLVDTLGCSLCPCTGPRTGGTWATRAQYVRCVRSALRRRGVSRSERRSATRQAQGSGCGRRARASS